MLKKSLPALLCLLLQLIDNAAFVCAGSFKDGVTLACSKPCHACEKALKRARVLKVIYTTGCDQHPFRTLILNS